MALKGLITIDLPGISDDNRDVFYEVLEELKWSKIQDLTTAWKVTFNVGIQYENAVQELESDLQKAKTKSKAAKVYYAIQLGEQNVHVSKIPK